MEGQQRQSLSERHRSNAINILLCSHLFPPSVGGLETVSRLLAEQFAALGHAVTVVTESPGEVRAPGYTILRQPSRLRLWTVARSADIIFQNNISLRTLVPTLFAGKPIVIAHHTWIRRADGSRGWQDRLKRLAVKSATNVAISPAIAAALPVPSVVLGNPFDMTVFTHHRNDPREKDLVFLGRLVSDKGCDLILHALAVLKTEGLRPTLTIIGDGPEKAALQGLASELCVAEQVAFLGTLHDSRAREVGLHKIMVVPSRWPEPFGVVALEGIAAGCVVSASSGGGLPEAVGPCGLLFRNGDVTGLASTLKQLLLNDALREQFRNRSGEHLAQFEPRQIAERYLDVFRRSLKG